MGRCLLGLVLALSMTAAIARADDENRYPRSFGDILIHSNQDAFSIQRSAAVSSMRNHPAGGPVESAVGRAPSLETMQHMFAVPLARRHPIVAALLHALKPPAAEAAYDRAVLTARMNRLPAIASDRGLPPNDVLGAKLMAIDAAYALIDGAAPHTAHDTAFLFSRMAASAFAGRTERPSAEALAATYERYALAWALFDVVNHPPRRSDAPSPRERDMLQSFARRYIDAEVADGAARLRFNDAGCAGSVPALCAAQRALFESSLRRAQAPLGHL